MLFSLLGGIWLHIHVSKTKPLNPFTATVTCAWGSHSGEHLWLQYKKKKKCSPPTCCTPSPHKTTAIYGTSSAISGYQLWVPARWPFKINHCNLSIRSMLTHPLSGLWLIQGVYMKSAWLMIAETFWVSQCDIGRTLCEVMVRLNLWMESHIYDKAHITGGC